MGKLIFFCPFIFDGGLEKTLKIYSDYFSKYYKVVIVTNTNHKSYIKFSNKIEIINPTNKFFYKNRYLNNIYCVYLIFIQVIKYSLYKNIYLF